MYAQPALLSPATFFQSPKCIRLAAEHNKLVRTTSAIIASLPDATPIGPDPIVEHLASSSGFGANDLIITRVVSRRAIFTVIVVPTRIWREEDDRATLLQVKLDAADEGTRVLLVPQSWSRGSTRRQIAEVLFRARSVTYTAEQQRESLHYLRTVKRSTIGECAMQIQNHPDPMGVVLSLCARRFVRFERSKPLSPTTAIFRV
jgi:hypothetical protein